MVGDNEHYDYKRHGQDMNINDEYKVAIKILIENILTYRLAYLNLIKQTNWKYV